jgi:hypothetical protein
MDLCLQRKHILEEHLAKDYDLLKKLEDDLRYEDDPKRKAGLQSDINDLKGQITARQRELDSLNHVLDSGLQETVKLYLAASFEHDQFAGLDQAGETDPDRSTLLQKVFIDLDVTICKGEQPRDLQLGRFPQLAKRGPNAERIFAPEEEGEEFSAMDCLFKEWYPRIAIIGGPGQGKSTMGQHLAQVHRAKLLGETCEFEPQIARIPFRIVLKYFAQWLADEPDLDNLETYLAKAVERLAGGRPVSAEDIQEILRCRPCLLILDGLDEVVVPELRERMLARIREFLRRTEELGTDLMVMATSRPTGYENQFDPGQFWHLELLPLSSEKVRAFAEKWVQAKKLHEEEQGRVLRTLEECEEDEGLSTLLTTPLQVTIILLIIKDGGRPPSQREALFSEYWSTIFRRERSKAKGVIQSDESLLFNLHAYLGYLLHRRAAGENVQSLLPEKEFRQAIREFLRREDSRSSDEAINQRIDQLVRDARDRLVLIVEPEPGLFGFELRPLQEFFAAVHMVQTAADTDQRFRRLKAIACSEHWHNVALFFAGRVAHHFRGEASNVLELVCRPLNREGKDRYLRRGAWLALEIAADGALSAVSRDLQYNAIEYGLDTLGRGLTEYQERNLPSIIERLSPEDRNDILRPTLEGKLHSLPTACLEPALSLWGQYFEATPLFQEKIDALLQTQRKDVLLSALDLALQREPDLTWMLERLRAHWPHWKEQLQRWWSSSPEYVERLLNTWSPSDTEVAELGEAVLEHPWYHSYPASWQHDKEPLWAISEPKSPMDQLIVMLRCVGMMIYWYRIRPSGDSEVELGKWGGISLFALEESQLPFHVSDSIIESLNGLLQCSDLMPWLRAQLWTLFWLINKPNHVNVSAFLEDVWAIQQVQLAQDRVWHYWPRAPWPLLRLAMARQRDKGPEAIKGLLLFLDADTQTLVAEQVAEAIRECVEGSDEMRQRQLLTAILSRTGLDKMLPGMVQSANKMGLTVQELVDAHIEGLRFTDEFRESEYTVGELRDSLIAAEGLLDRSDKLSRLLWSLAYGVWPSAPEVLDQVQQFLELVLARCSESAKAPFTELSVALSLKLLAHYAQTQQIAPRLFTALSQSGSLEPHPLYFGKNIGELSPECLSELGAFLTHGNEAIRTGAAVFWKAVIDAATRYEEPSLDELWKVKSIRFAPETGLALIKNDDDKRRLEGIALLTLSDYPVEDVRQRDILLGLLQQSQNTEEEQAWAQFLLKTPISDAKHLIWCQLLEKVLDEPQSYGNLVLSAAMERYQRLTNASIVAFSEIEEKELGLP